MSRRPRSPALGERVAALEAVWDSFPQLLASKLAEALAEYTPHTTHKSLEDRVAELERKNAYSAGAVKVEQRTAAERSAWAREVVSVFGPYILAGVAFVMLAMKGG